MSLDDLVNVVITALTASPSVQGFGTPLIAAYHTHYVDRVRTYTKPGDMTADGFLVTDPAYLAASAICAQNPKVANFKVGRRALPPTQTLHFQCLSAVQGDVYKVTIGKAGTALTALTRTVPGSSSTSAEATAIAALMSAVSGVTATALSDTITVTATAGAGALLDVQLWTANFNFSDVTADPGIATDLAAIAAADNGWYGLTLDSNSNAEEHAAATWVEANQKLFVCNNSDSACYSSSSTTDIMAVVQAAAYTRTGVLFSGQQLLSYSGAAWQGNRLADPTPGDDTWAYKTLATILVDNLSETNYQNIIAKKGNVYVVLAGLNITLFGTSGSGEFFDLVRFIDWLHAQIQVRVFGLLANNKKIPYTDAGADIIRSTILGALTDGVNAGGLVAGTTSVTIPPVATQAATDRANRNMPNISFAGKLAGAVHTLVINGVLTI